MDPSDPSDSRKGSSTLHLNGLSAQTSSIEEKENPSYLKECCMNGWYNFIGCFVTVFQAIGSCFCSFCHYGDQQEEAGSEILPPWRMLWVEFVNRTTWHGLKYLELRSRYLARKFIWAFIMTSNITLFLYIMTTKLQNLLDYPVTVSITVNYGQTPVFPAATICNHNPFRMTVMQNLGLYDIMVSDLDSTCEECGNFRFYPGICNVRAGETPDSFYLKIKDVTRRVCMYMCTEGYDTSCSGFMYNRWTKSCTLTSYTGEWYNPDDPKCEPGSPLEFYRRIRKTPNTKIICTFEDSLCPLTSINSESDSFVWLEAKDDDVQIDNTLSLGSGHLMTMKKTELKSGYTAQMALPYLNTTNSCMEFFYRLKLEDPDSGDLPNLAVYAVTEEKEKKLLISTKRYIRDWSRLFTKLPDGLHQIIIEGTRAMNQSSGMAIDDLTIEKCDNIETLGNCKQTRKGSAYLGTISHTAKNETCMPWDQVKSPLIYRLPDLNAKDAKNYCRNIPQEDWSEPACFVDSNDDIYVSMCNIPFCECFNDTYFKCDNGLCLPPSLLCNGAKDCFDGTDEAEICRNRQNVACEFNDDYVCGYTTDSVGRLTWTKVPSTELSSYTDVTIFKNVMALSHLMFLDSKLGQNGDVIQLTSPLWNFTTWTTVSFTYIIIASDGSTSDSSSLSLYQYSALRSPVRLLVQVLPSQSKDFQQQSACVPPGQYHLMFQGVQGQPFEQIIGIPFVSLGGPCVYDNKTNSLQSKDFTSLESGGPIAFNCSFTSLCGYKFLSTSKYLTWNLIYFKNALNTTEPNTTCGSTFKGVQGYIYSPGYPNDYPANSDCRFYIDEPEGTTITLIFHEFDIQTQSDCLADSLKIEDPFDDKNKLTACGNIRPRDFKSRGNRLELIFTSDGYDNSGKFKIQYFTYANNITDYAVAFKYSSPLELNKFIHKATLISPSTKIFSPMCLVVTMIAVTPFKIKMSYLTDSFKYTEIVLLTSTTSLGWSWHKQWLNIGILDKEFVTRYEFEVGDSSIKDPGLIGDISIKEGNCRSLPELQSSTLQCDFTNIYQCGYFDNSDGPVHWFRVYNSMTNAYYLMSSFPASQSKQTVSLISAEIPSSANEQCVQVNYFTNFKTFVMTISSSNPNDAPTVSKDLVTDGEFQVSYPLKSSVGNRTINIITTSTPSTAFKGDDVEQEVRLRRIDVLEGPCPTAVDDSAKIDCAFDNFLACNYKLTSSFGASWMWAAWPDLIGDQTLRRSGVLYYAQTRRSTLKGVLTTPLISSEKTSELIFHAYVTNTGHANLSILVGDSLGLPTSQTTLMEVTWDNNQTWQNFTVCIPPGNWHLFFVADILHESETNNKGPIKPFIAIDNVSWNTVSSDHCITQIKNISNTTKCNATDLTDCPSSLISWSNAMKWMMVNNAPSIFSQTKEDCLYLFDQSEGWFSYEDTNRQILNTSECDIYIRGKGQINVTIWFDVFEIQNCIEQYLQVWYRNSTGATSGEWICSRTVMAPRTYVTDHILQIHIKSFNKFPKVRFHYKYTSETTEGYMYGFYYDGVTEYKANTTLDEKYTVASWLSPEIPIDITKVSSSTGQVDLCVRIDLLLDYLKLDVYTYYQQSPTSVKTNQVFTTSSHRYSDQGWTNATFQVKFDLPDGYSDLSIHPTYFHKHQFLFTFSIDSHKELNVSKVSGGQLLAALDNLKINQGPCPLNNPTSSKLSCKASDRSSCQFVDISEGPSRWIASTHLAKTAENNKECQLSDNGYVYIGNVSTTIFSRTCQRWDSQVPQKHNQDLADYFPDLSMNSTGNKCRNPSNPFIPRNCWCYTMDPLQRREYCDIPPCLDAYFQAELSSMTMEPAIFITKLDISTDSCLEFLYDTTTTLVDIEINARQTLDGENVFRTLLKREQATTSLNWMKSSVSVYSTDKYLIFLARKTDYTDNIPYAYLSNITVTPGACQGDGNKPTPRVSRVDYKGPRLNWTDYQSVLLYEIKNETMETLNIKMAHQQKDLIHSCKFDNVDCGTDDIISQMTDMGQCYTFNSNSTKEVTTTGAMSGLRLILNVESYEHVPGYVSGVGVKMYFHDSSEVPSMQSLGLAAQPGLHSLGILSYTTTQNLQPPFGECGEVPLNLSDSSETYTEAKCRLERNTLEFDEKCNCKEAYMPGNIEVCNLTSYLHCSENVHYSNIRCPSACEIESFSVQLSQARLSGLRIGEVLGDKSGSVKYKYQAALEVSHRVETKVFGNIILNMVTTAENLLKLRDYIYFSLIQFETSSIKHIEMAIQTFIKFAIDEIQTGGIDVISESDLIYNSIYKPPLSYFLTSMSDIYETLAFYRGVQNVAYNNDKKTSEDILWYKQTANDTFEKLVGFVRASEVFMAEMKSIAQVKTPSICPMLEEEMSNLSNRDCNCLYDILEKKTNDILAEFSTVIAILYNDDDPFSTPGKQVKVQTINDMLELISLTTICKSEYEIVSKSVKDWLKSDSLFPEMKNYTGEIISQNMLIGFNEIQAWINDMKTDYLSSAITLTDLANNVTTGRMDSQMRKINTIITDISQRVVVPMLDSMTTIDLSIVNVYQEYISNLILLDNSSEFTNFEVTAKKLNIWRKPSINLEMPEKINFELLPNQTWQVWPSSEPLTSFYGSRSRSRLNVLTTNYFTALRDQINAFTAELTERYETVKKNADFLNSIFTDYLKSTEVDEDFIMTNFLVLDIYYGEMKFDSISTASSYEWINFFSDLGSYFGLLMGCSVLTMFEVIDLMVYHSIVKLVEFYEERKQKRRHVISINIPSLPPTASPEKEKSFAGILNRAFSPERKLGNSKPPKNKSTKIGLSDYDRNDPLPPYQSNGGQWNVPL